MWKHLALLAAFDAALFGQFRNLVTNDEGSLVIFSSSLRMQGADQLPFDKLFSADSAGFRLYAQRQKEDAPPGTPYAMSNYYRMESAELSGDGAVRALITVRECQVGGSTCLLNFPKVRSELTGLPDQSSVTLNGYIRLSRNGRYAVLCCDGSMASSSVLRDLYTGETRALELRQAVSARRIVSSSGAAVVPRSDSLAIVTLTETRHVPVSAQPLHALIDDGAASAIYAGQMAQSGMLLARVDLGTGVERTLVRAGSLSLVGASNDGGVIAFLSAEKLTSTETGGLPQLFTIRADGTSVRQVTRDPAGILEAALAGNGNVAYAVTAAGRLIRIDSDLGTINELIGRTVTLQPPSGGPGNTPVAGSAFCIRGTGLADSARSTAPPLPTSFNGLQILLGGQPVALQFAGPTKACFQIPWDTPIGTHTLAAITDSDPRFQGGFPIDLRIVSTAFAQFIPLDPGFPVAAHEDFTNLVTMGHPARPGEIIHFYMTGLGTVKQTVPSGSPAPANPPAAVTGPFACRFSDFQGGARAAEVLFAGLAPGLAGYYQVSVRLPTDIPINSDRALISCSVGQSYYGESAWIPIMRR